MRRTLCLQILSLVVLCTTLLAGAARAQGPRPAEMAGLRNTNVPTPQATWHIEHIDTARSFTDMGNRFQIAGGTPGLEISWQVTGIRHDPYAEAYRIPVEQVKPADEQGTYLHPELYGQPASATEGYGKWPAEMKAAPSPAPVPAEKPE
jgi:hypothetical protein